MAKRNDNNNNNMKTKEKDHNIETTEEHSNGESHKHKSEPQAAQSKPIKAECDTSSTPSTKAQNTHISFSEADLKLLKFYGYSTEGLDEDEIDVLVSECEREVREWEENYVDVSGSDR